MKKLIFICSAVLIFIGLVTFIGCQKESIPITADHSTEDEISALDAFNGDDCEVLIQGKLKNDKHRKVVKKYYDNLLAKDLRLNKIGKTEWKNTVTLDNYNQIISIVPVVNDGTGNTKQVTHVFVLYTNWFGHQYLLLDRNSDVGIAKNRELKNNLFEIAEFVTICPNKPVEFRTGECGVIDWILGPGVTCPSFGDSFWRKVGNFFRNIFEDIFESFSSGGGDPNSSYDWSNYFYYNFGYDNTNALYYTSYDGGGGGGPYYNSGDPSESLEPSQMQALQNCVANSNGLASKTEQILNDFKETPNIQYIVADNLLELCSNGNGITPTQIEDAVARDIMMAYSTIPGFEIIRAAVHMEYEYLKKQWISSNSRQPTLFERAKLFRVAVWNVIDETTHIILDFCGLFPVFGEGCDAANGVLYTIEGDYLNASFSYAAVVPFTGWAAIGTKYLAYAVKRADGVVTNLIVKNVGGIIDFGNRSDLRKALGMATGDSRQAHHLIPWAHREHPTIQTVARNAQQGSDFFHMSYPRNGLAIDSGRQAARPGEITGHKAYNDRVYAGLEKIQETFGLNDTKRLKEELVKFEDFLRNKIEANPNLHLNDIIFNYIPIK